MIIFDYAVVAEATLWILTSLLQRDSDVEIWIDSHDISYIKFLKKELSFFNDEVKIRMRPDGYTTPWHEIKEKWISEHIDHMVDSETIIWKNEIEMAFEPAGSQALHAWKHYGVTCLEVHDD